MEIVKMNDIKIKIKNKIALCPEKYLVSSNSNYRLIFEFDEEWKDSPIKTARILFGEQSLDIVMQGNSVELPPIPACERIFVGVFSDSLATSSVEIGCISSIADSDSEPLFEFAESQYNQIIELLNSIDFRRIDSVSRIDNNMIILYNDGTETSLPLYDGVSVSQAAINDGGELIFDFSDGKTINCGNVKGSSGSTPSFSVGTVQSLEAGSDAFVEITGTQENPVLNFGIPKGDSSSESGFSRLTDEEKQTLAQIVIENLPAAEGSSF